MVLTDNHSGYRLQFGHNDCIFSCLLLIVSFIPKSSSAGLIESFSITERDGQYEARIVALFDAPAAYVFRVIKDYKHIYRINPSIVRTELLPSADDGVIRVKNRIEHCIAVFCIEVDMVEDVVEIGEGHLVTTTVPEESSFKYGASMWHVRPFGNSKSRVQYRSSIKPDFFIPPLIGTLLVKSMIHEEVSISFKKIECHAKILAERGIKEISSQLAKRQQEENDCAG